MLRISISYNCLILIPFSYRNIFLLKKLFVRNLLARFTVIWRAVSLKRSCTCVVSVYRVKGVSKSDVCRQRVYVLNVKWLTLSPSLTASAHGSGGSVRVESGRAVTCTCVNTCTFNADVYVYTQDETVSRMHVCVYISISRVNVILDDI